MPAPPDFEMRSPAVWEAGRATSQKQSTKECDSTAADFQARKLRRAFSRPGKRLRELERVIKDRHGIVPDTDDADIYLFPVAQCFWKLIVDKGKNASVDEVMKRFGFWCEKWAPHITPDQGAAIICQVLAGGPKLVGDDALGASLRLSYADRQRLRITTIGSYDIDRKSRTKLQRARRRERNRLRAAEKRRLAGATPRAEYQARSLSRTKPWEQIGICRRTYERRRNKGLLGEVSGASGRQAMLKQCSSSAVASASPHPISIHGRRTCVTADKPQLQRRHLPPVALATEPSTADMAREVLEGTAAVNATKTKTINTVHAARSVLACQGEDQTSAATSDSDVCRHHALDIAMS
jgi:hypothetical protein